MIESDKWRSAHTCCYSTPARGDSDKISNVRLPTLVYQGCHSTAIHSSALKSDRLTVKRPIKRSPDDRGHTAVEGILG
jgi:hypothetical protein